MDDQKETRRMVVHDLTTFSCRDDSPGTLLFRNAGGWITYRRPEFESIECTFGDGTRLQRDTDLLINDISLINAFSPDLYLRRKIEEYGLVAMLIGGESGTPFIEETYNHFMSEDINREFDIPRFAALFGHEPTNSLADQGYFFQIPSLESYSRFIDRMPRYPRGTDVTRIHEWQEAMVRRYNCPVQCTALDLIARPDFRQAVQARNYGALREIVQRECPETVFAG